MVNSFKLSSLAITLLLASSFIISESQSSQELLENLPPDQRQLALQRLGIADSEDNSEIKQDYDGKNVLLLRPNLGRDLTVNTEDFCSECIFGYDLFRFTPTTFSPTNKTMVSSSYVLGPEDDLKITYYGSRSTTSEESIDREGNLNLPLLGPINLAGLTFKEAREIIKNKINSELIGTEVNVTLVRLRSITVYVVGEAYQPGSYNLSSLSTITNALFLSGGVNKNGSLRNIKVNRDGNIVNSYDLYDLLLKGNASSDMQLQDGDTIFIPFIENKVKLKGPFKRPFVYEFLEGESVKDAIFLAGGYKISGASENIGLQLSYIDRDKRSIISFSTSSEILDRPLSNDDLITVNQNSSLTSQSVQLKGEVKFPGVYSITKGDTILDVLNKAGGYNEHAYSEGAIFTRLQVAKQQKEGFKRMADSLEKTAIDIAGNGDSSEFVIKPIATLIERLRTEEPIGRQVVDVDILTLKTDPFSNFKVRDGDVLFIPERPNSINVVGEVLNSSTLRYVSGKSLAEYIDLSGGYTDKADNGKIFIVLPNGQAVPYKRKLFRNSSNILPGSTIVVSRNSRPFDAISLTRIVAPIFADLATSAAAIAAISNN